MDVLGKSDYLGAREMGILPEITPLVFTPLTGFQASFIFFFIYFKEGKSLILIKLVSLADAKHHKTNAVFPSFKKLGDITKVRSTVVGAV